MQTIPLGGQPLKTNAAGLVSLTDLHRAAAANEQADGKRKPGDWAREAGAPFIEFVADQLNTRKTGIYVTTKGKGGGTFAHWQIALAYAKYLSPALHMQVNQVYARYKAADVTLAAEIADKAKPADTEWLAKRVQSTVARNKLTSTLAAHGVAGRGFADCTNAIYRHVLGGKKSEICAQRGLRKSINLRNVMDAEQLTLTAMSEIVARRRIHQANDRGNVMCERACDAASASVVALARGAA